MHGTQCRALPNNSQLTLAAQPTVVFEGCSVIITQLCHFSTKSNHRQYVNRWVWLQADKISFTTTDISYKTGGGQDFVHRPQDGDPCFSENRDTKFLYLLPSLSCPGLLRSEEQRSKPKRFPSISSCPSQRLQKHLKVNNACEYLFYLPILVTMRK